MLQTNPTTFSPEPLTQTQITIRSVAVGPDGYAFAVVNETGEQVFISSRLASTMKLESGQTWNAVLVPNTNRPDRTPWFAKKLVSTESDARTECLAAYRAMVLHTLLKEGGAWTAAEMAEWCEGLVWETATVLEILYTTDRRVAKIVMFSDPKQPGQKIWYTTAPENIEVDEWVDE